MCCSIEIKAGNPFLDSVLKQLLVRRPLSPKEHGNMRRKERMNIWALSIVKSFVRVQ